jgi:Tfp pilus assembly pilus retraction ATPase PilT
MNLFSEYQQDFDLELLSIQTHTHIPDLKSIQMILTQMKLHAKTPQQKQIVTEYQLRLNHIIKSQIVEEKHQKSTLEEKHQKSLQTLEQSLKQLQETEQVAQATSQQLAAQTKKIEKVQENRKQADASLDDSNSLLRRMQRWWRS